MQWKKYGLGLLIVIAGVLVGAVVNAIAGGVLVVLGLSLMALTPGAGIGSAD